MSNEVEIKAVRQVQRWERDRRFYKIKEVTYTIGKTEHTLDIGMHDFDAGRMKELVLADAERIKTILGKIK